VQIHPSEARVDRVAPCYEEGESRSNQLRGDRARPTRNGCHVGRNGIIIGAPDAVFTTATVRRVGV
jgi:hypothetical protein